MKSYFKTYPLTIQIYFLTRIFVGLRFIIPIWVTFFLKIITFEQMAIGEVIPFIFGTLMELPTGVFADIFGRKISTIIGLSINGFGYIMLALATDFQSYIVASFICALGVSFTSGAEEALVYDSLKESGKLYLYSKVKSIESAIYRTILLISTVLGGYLYKIKIILPYLITGITLIIAGFFYIFVKEPKIDSEKFSFKGYLIKFRKGFTESFRNSNVSVTSIYYILIFSAGFLLMAYFEQPFTKWLGFSEEAIGWIFGLTLFVKIFTTLLAPKLEKIFSERFINFTLPFLTGIVLLLTINNKIIGIIILLIENILLAYRFIFTQNTLNKKIRSNYRASALSTLSMFTNVIYIIFVYGLSKILKFDNVGYSFNIIGILLIIASGVSLFIKYEKKISKVKN